MCFAKVSTSQAVGHSQASQPFQSQPAVAQNKPDSSSVAGPTHTDTLVSCEFIYSFNFNVFRGPTGIIDCSYQMLHIRHYFQICSKWMWAARCVASAEAWIPEARNKEARKRDGSRTGDRGRGRRGGGVCSPLGGARQQLLSPLPALWAAAAHGSTESETG